MLWSWKEQVERDERLGSLLRDSAPQGELLNWRAIEHIVATAPAARIPWFSRIVATPAPMRYALAPMTVLLAATGALWVMPAQSEQVGTLVYTSLPAVWQVPLAGQSELQLDVPTYNRVQQQKEVRLAELGLPQAAVQMFVVPREGRDHLVFTMLNVPGGKARELMAALETDFPPLAGHEAGFVDMLADQEGSRLSQLIEQVQRKAGRGLPESEVARQVLGALHGAGLDDLDVTYERQADGSLLVTVEGSFKLELNGHTQEQPAGGTDGPAGSKAQAGELLELASPRP